MKELTKKCEELLKKAINPLGKCEWILYFIDWRRGEKLDFLMRTEDNFIVNGCEHWAFNENWVLSQEVLVLPGDRYVDPKDFKNLYEKFIKKKIEGTGINAISRFLERAVKVYEDRDIEYYGIVNGSKKGNFYIFNSLELFKNVIFCKQYADFLDYVFGYCAEKKLIRYVETSFGRTYDNYVMIYFDRYARKDDPLEKKVIAMCFANLED